MILIFRQWNFRILLIILNAFYVHLSTDTSFTTTSPNDPPTSHIPDVSSNVTESANTTSTPTTTLMPSTTAPDYGYLALCPDNVPCKDLGGECISCQFNYYCKYGSEQTAICEAKPNITCHGDRKFTRSYSCRYCYQMDHWLYSCNSSTDCTVKTAPQHRVFARCAVRDDKLCLGSRTFYKSIPCNWTSGYKWSTALVLSITLGGFGVDRFYLGLWKEGIGKLFSFGGLGVWTIVDVILIAVGYVGPYDGSLYIYPW